MIGREQYLSQYYYACGRNERQAGMFFGLILFNYLMHRPDGVWGFGRFEKDGVPIESTTYKFAKCLQKRFGIVPGITDKSYITNSYHVFVREEIDAFSKLKFESQFQALSSGGAISYVEVPDMKDNIAAVLQVIRFIYDNNYFNDRYQGIPIGGYTKIIEKMLDGIEVKTDTDYFEFIKENPDIAEKTLFTGMIDEYFGYKLGALEYRSVRFETEVLDTDNYQGNAVVNYTEREVPYTRIIEHKHFEFGKQEKTVISREYSSEWKVGMEPYYPVNNEQNNKLFEEYKKLAEQEKNVIFGGRLGNYKYYDMDKVIAAALKAVEKEKNN